jgi:hypothetical protein
MLLLQRVQYCLHAAALLYCLALLWPVIAKLTVLWTTAQHWLLTLL